MPALRANGDPAVYTDENGIEQPGIPYYDDPDPVENEDGTFIYPEPQLIRVAIEAKPIVAIYCDELPETNGLPYYGHCKKPVFQVKGNKILVAWTTKFAKGGKPRYSITMCDDPDTPEVETPETGCQEICRPASNLGDDPYCEPDYPHDDPYYADDIWGVSGPQRSVDYTDQGYPEVGEVPYSAVWVARAVILTASDLTKAPWNVTSTVDGSALYSEGEIVWFKPERLTSARRDANQNFLAGADGAGFAVTWQEERPISGTAISHGAISPKLTETSRRAVTPITTMKISSAGPRPLCRCPCRSEYLTTMWSILITCGLNLIMVLLIPQNWAIPVLTMTAISSQC